MAKKKEEDVEVEEVEEETPAPAPSALEPYLLVNSENPELPLKTTPPTGESRIQPGEKPTGHSNPDFEWTEEEVAKL